MEDACRKISQSLLEASDKELELMLEIFRTRPREWSRREFEEKLALVDQRFAPQSPAWKRLRGWMGLTTPLPVDESWNEVKLILQERANQNFFYYFYSNHGLSHAHEVSANVENFLRYVPTRFQDSYRSLNNALWKARMSDALLLHDQEVFASRAIHPELGALTSYTVLKNDIKLPDLEIAIRSALVLFHSKTALPPAELTRLENLAQAGSPGELVTWFEANLSAKIPNQRDLIDGFVSTLKGIDSSTWSDLFKAARIVRVADAQRPLSQGSLVDHSLQELAVETPTFANSIAHPFAISPIPDERPFVLNTDQLPPRRIWAPSRDAHVIFGNLAITAPDIRRSQNSETIVFALRVPVERAVKDLLLKALKAGVRGAHGEDLLHNAKAPENIVAIYKGIFDILSEYPSEWLLEYQIALEP